jgi:hypothetical protein
MQLCGVVATCEDQLPTKFGGIPIRIDEVIVRSVCLYKKRERKKQYDRQVYSTLTFAICALQRFGLRSVPLFSHEKQNAPLGFLSSCVDEKLL